MNNKGFTLIELIVIIGLLSVMIGIFSVNMNKSSLSLNDEINGDQYSELVIATDAYVHMYRDVFLDTLYSGSGTITVRGIDLRREGLIGNGYDDRVITVRRDINTGTLIIKEEN